MEPGQHDPQPVAEEKLTANAELNSQIRVWKKQSFCVGLGVIGYNTACGKRIVRAIRGQ